MDHRIQEKKDYLCQMGFFVNFRKSAFLFMKYPN